MNKKAGVTVSLHFYQTQIMLLTLIKPTLILFIIIKIITALLQKGNGVVSKIGFINFFLFIDLFNVIVYRATKLFSTMFGLFLEYLNQ